MSILLRRVRKSQFDSVIVNKYSKFFTSTTAINDTSSTTSSPDTHSSKNTTIASLSTTIKNLENRLTYTATTQSDQVLSDMKAIHDMNIGIPLTYSLDVADLFARRHDLLRIEILLRLIKSNAKYQNECNSSNIIGTTNQNYTDNQFSSFDTKSRPQHNPDDKLISFAVSKLIRYGDVEFANLLWVRMSESGYITHRITLDKILDEINSCKNNEVSYIVCSCYCCFCC